MKDRPDRTARLQVIGRMFAGQTWQTAVIQSQLNISRSTASRLVKLARDEDKVARAFLDDRHGHPYKVTEPVRVWMVELCTQNPQMASSRLQAELKIHEVLHKTNGLAPMDARPFSVYRLP